jgi:hypothetical protein
MLNNAAISSCNGSCGEHPLFPGHILSFIAFLLMTVRLKQRAICCSFKTMHEVHSGYRECTHTRTDRPAVQTTAAPAWVKQGLCQHLPAAQEEMKNLLKTIG